MSELDRSPFKYLTGSSPDRALSVGTGRESLMWFLICSDCQNFHSVFHLLGAHGGDIL